MEETHTGYLDHLIARIYRSFDDIRNTRVVLPIQSLEQALDRCVAEPFRTSMPESDLVSIWCL